jgi:hypothetical protein
MNSTYYLKEGLFDSKLLQNFKLSIQKLRTTTTTILNLDTHGDIVCTRVCAYDQIILPIIFGSVRLKTTSIDAGARVTDIVNGLNTKNIYDAVDGGVLSKLDPSACYCVITTTCLCFEDDIIFLICSVCFHIFLKKIHLFVPLESSQRNYNVILLRFRIRRLRLLFVLQK